MGVARNVSLDMSDTTTVPTTNNLATAATYLLFYWMSTTAVNDKFAVITRSHIKQSNMSICLQKKKTNSAQIWDRLKQRKILSTTNQTRISQQNFVSPSQMSIKVQMRMRHMSIWMSVIHNRFSFQMFRMFITF